MGNDKTKWIFDDNDDLSSDSSVDFTETIGNTQGHDEFTVTPDDDETTKMVPQSEKTTIAVGDAFDPEEDPDTAGMSDPVVGWLVVVKGPGMGQAVALGAGMNTVGRSPSQRVAFPFGDRLMSSEDHARIIYDDDSRAFFIAHGSGKNITKVNGQMVANTLPLENGATVELTKATHLRFVAFCSEDFDWADVTDADGA
ncbi:FHA domain-containing protein [Litoreibacter roseus]|uniref:FHA domain-containing protein n=1 Tax=Litoreibacter roseus TaxID=2601869 RepID=A0A6N6JD38_9RHOB|nr:FHA domain-containing protein [Litoreibacter roseus]GFE64086.1 hypothetical protein KIN_11600 [Litoreibacter roseus]